MNRMVCSLEKYFSTNIGVDNIIFTGMARIAITATLKALGVSSGDEVVIPAFICSAVEKAVTATGAKPVYVDLGQNDLNISAEEIDRVLSERTKAIIVNHTYGYYVDAEKIKRLCDERRLFLIEDCVSSFSVDYRYSGKRVHGDAAIFSIYKMLVNTGGSFIATDNRELAVRCRRELDMLKGITERTTIFRRLYSNAYTLWYSIFETYGLRPPFYTGLVKVLRGYHRKQLRVDDAGSDNRIMMTTLEHYLAWLQLPFLKWHRTRRVKAIELIQERLSSSTEIWVPSLNHEYDSARNVLVRLAKEKRDRFVELASKRGVVTVTPWVPLASLSETLRMSNDTLLFPIRPFTYVKDISRLRATLSDLESEFS
jgi:dTDP-4-amino-4,6-dideoxygalactose transaminase